jgi:uncharacterized protein
MTALRPSAQLKPFFSAVGQHVFVVGGSRIYDISEETATSLEHALLLDSVELVPDEIAALLDRRGHDPMRAMTAPPKVNALSLNIAQSCNMGCGYCYAQQGTFGGAKKVMSEETARASVDRLLEWAPAGSRVVIAFMGGEPLLNRSLLHSTVKYAAEAAQRSGHFCSFSLTTNATLVTEHDARLFRDHPFSITVSIDGPSQVQDRQRPMLGGRASTAHTLRGLGHLLEQRPRQLDARMTVTAQTGPLIPVLDHVLSLGFDSAGFAPVVAAPKPETEIHGVATSDFTQAMIACGRHALAKLLAGERYGFANLETALHELHKGSGRSHPCGAGAGYLSIDADGDAFGCHRLVGDDRFRFGSLTEGIDDALRLDHLSNRAVDGQEPCRSCWARYLCGGGCYHEVAARGRTHCDYIRGWLGFCLEAYATLSAERPERFGLVPVTQTR